MRKIGVGTWECSIKERQYVNEVLTSGRLSYGPFSKKLESRFATLHDSKYGVLSNSGTSSLHVALQALKELHGWKDGDKVIIPAITFVATANIVLHNRMIPVPVDIDPVTYNIDPELATERARLESARAIIPVHMFGQPADMSYFAMWVNRNQTKIIEDACEAAFALVFDKPVGAWGDIGCFSTYIAHLLTTGVGGISVTSNPDYAAKMRSLVNHGRDGIYIDIDTEATKEVISRRFKFNSVGHSYRITELEAAIGVAQLENWIPMVATRKANAEYLTDNLTYLNEVKELIQLPRVAEFASHSWMMYPIVLRHEDKWGLVNKLEENGIETREMMPLINQPCYEGLWNPDDYPVAQWIDKGGFYIPSHQALTLDDLDRMLETIYDYFNRA